MFWGYESAKRIKIRVFEDAPRRANRAGWPVPLRNKEGEKRVLSRDYFDKMFLVIEDEQL